MLRPMFRFHECSIIIQLHAQCTTNKLLWFLLQPQSHSTFSQIALNCFKRSNRLLIDSVLGFNLHFVYDCHERFRQVLGGNDYSATERMYRWVCRILQPNSILTVRFALRHTSLRLLSIFLRSTINNRKLTLHTQYNEFSCGLVHVADAALIKICARIK